VYVDYHYKNFYAYTNNVGKCNWGKYRENEILYYEILCSCQQKLYLVTMNPSQFTMEQKLVIWDLRLAKWFSGLGHCVFLYVITTNIVADHNHLHLQSRIYIYIRSSAFMAVRMWIMIWVVASCNLMLTLRMCDTWHWTPIYLCPYVYTFCSFISG
jgi:hypothetical protein